MEIEAGIIEYNRAECLHGCLPLFPVRIFGIAHRRAVYGVGARVDSP